MESNHISYDYIASFNRIDSILNESDNSFEELSEIPARKKLTFNNGFYVYCTAVFVDIRGSSQLPQIHNRPILAKLYRSYISEVVAIMNGNNNCAEISIVGDCISGVYNTPKKHHIDGVFHDCATIKSMIDVLNSKFRKRNITEIKIGIGVDYGRALMIKSGYSGSGLNDIVWMGDVVNNASNLCGKANKDFFSQEICISKAIYTNLSDINQKFMSWNSMNSCYDGSVIRTDINEWLENNS